jgi:hypothetical protein
MLSKSTAIATRHASFLMHSLLRYDGWKPGKHHDVELYFTVHKSFVSTSLNLIHRGCTSFISAIPIGQLLNYTKIQWAQSPWPRAQININSDKNIIQWLLFNFQTLTSWQTMSNAKLPLLFYSMFSKSRAIVKAMLHGAIFLATCNAILLLRDVN